MYKIYKNSNPNPRFVFRYTGRDRKSKVYTRSTKLDIKGQYYLQNLYSNYKSIVSKEFEYNFALS